MRSSLAVSLLSLVVGCGAATTSMPSNAGLCSPGQEASLGADLGVRCLVEGVWVFTALSPAEHAFAAYPANGLVIEDGDHAVLIDTAWTPAQADALVAWAEARHRPITAAMVTHFHDDRVGGAPALNARGIPVFALNETATLAEARGTPFVHEALEPGSIPSVTWMYSGRGHAPENVVVFVERAQLLYGGCFIKEAGATSLGNLSDADVPSWLASIDLVIASYPSVVHVVPGHGAPGGPELLTHTRALVHPPECTVDAECTVTIETLEPCACCSCVEPRALSLSAIATLRSQLLDCQPICEGSCPSCTPPEELSHLVARCAAGFCALERRP